MLLSFLLTATVPLFAQSDSDQPTEQSPIVEESGGIYPAESQGNATTQIVPEAPNVGKAHRAPPPHFSNQLNVASQTQNEIKPGYYILEGYVDISYKNLRLQADHAEFNSNTKDLIATGNVVLDQEDQHITGDRLELNMDTKKGTMYNARGFVPPQIFFWGKKLDKLGEETYQLHDGVMTECSQISPHWHLDATKSTMTLEKYIHFTNFTLKAKHLPIFYSPYMMWPIKRDRATGFLFPRFGPNSKKGFYVGGSFFWAISRSMDSTFWLDHYNLRGWGGGTEYEYALSPESGGTGKVYVANDTLLGTQWTADGEIKQTLPSDFRVAGIVDWFSSFRYVRDFARTVERAASQTKTAQLFVTRNWSYYSFNGFMDWRELSDTNANYHLPELGFQVRSQQIGHTPFFWTLLSSADELGQTINLGHNNVSNLYMQRYDFLPSISWPVTYLSWLTVTPAFAHRVTYYSDQHPIDTLSPLGTSLTRNYNEFTLDFRGPNFGKIFETPDMSYSKKWKHAIEPQLTYHYLQDIFEQKQIYGIDTNDIIFGDRAITYSLTNLLYAKRPVKDEPDYEPDEYQYYNPKPLEEPPETAWELISWKVSQSYRFDSDSFNPDRSPTTNRFSDVNSAIRFSPNQASNVQFSLSYNVKFKQVTGIQIGSTLKSTSNWNANLSYQYLNLVPDDTVLLPGRRKAQGNSLLASGGFGFWKKRLVLSGDIGYNFTESELLGSTIGVTYNEDCFSIGVEMKQFGQQYRLNGKERQILFSVSLPNIGNLINFNNGAAANKY